MVNNSKAPAIRDALIQKFVSGEIRMKDAEKFMEEFL
jgi:hypothetical protein